MKTDVQSCALYEFELARGIGRAPDRKIAPLWESINFLQHKHMGSNGLHGVDEGWRGTLPGLYMCTHAGCIHCLAAFH